MPDANIMGELPVAETGSLRQESTGRVWAEQGDWPSRGIVGTKDCYETR